VFTIKRTEEFNTWLLGLKDGVTRRRLLVRLRKASLGNLGDVKSVGGGAKRTQQADIAAAKARAANIDD